MSPPASIAWQLNGLFGRSDGGVTSGRSLGQFAEPLPAQAADPPVNGIEVISVSDCQDDTLRGELGDFECGHLLGGQRWALLERGPHHALEDPFQAHHDDHRRPGARDHGRGAAAHRHPRVATALPRRAEARTT